MGHQSGHTGSTQSGRGWKAVSVRWLSGLIALAVVAIGGVWYLAQPKPDVAAYVELTERWVDNDLHYRQLIADAPQNRSRLILEYRQQVGDLTNQFFNVADRHNGTKGQLALLLFLFSQTQDPVVRSEAEGKLIEQLNSSDIKIIADALNMVVGAKDSELKVVNSILARVQSEPEHPSSARLLARACTLIEDVAASQFQNIADTLIERYRDSEDIGNFCEKLGGLGSGSVAGSAKYLPHLVAIFESNPHRCVRCPALFAIAKTHQDSSSESEQQKAVELYQQFLREFDGSKSYRYASVERSYRFAAGKAIEEIESRGVGKMAIEIDGFDLRGADLRLSEYEGRVVLLSFWASWCHPCLEMIPHEIELANEFKNQPFAIVGANGDTDPTDGLRSAQEHGIPWPSFQFRDKSGSPISDSWRIQAWPTMVLIDADGVVRKTWTGGQEPDEIRREIQSVIDAIVD